MVGMGSADFHPRNRHKCGFDTAMRLILEYHREEPECCGPKGGMLVMESPSWLPDLLQIHQTYAEKVLQAQAREAFALEQIETFAAYFAAGTVEYLTPHSIPRARTNSRSQTIWVGYWRSTTPVVVSVHHTDTASTLCLEVDERRLWTYSVTRCEPVDFTPAIEAFKRWMQAQPLASSQPPASGGRLRAYLRRTGLVRWHRERRAHVGLPIGLVTATVTVAVLYFAAWAAMISGPPAAPSFYPNFVSMQSNISAQQWASLKTMHITPTASLGSVLPFIAQEDVGILGQPVTVQTFDHTLVVSLPMQPHYTVWVFREQGQNLVPANSAARQLARHPRLTVDTLLAELDTIRS